MAEKAARGCARPASVVAAAALVYCLVPGLSAVQAGEKVKTEPSKFLAPAELAELAEKSKVSYATTILKGGENLPAFTHPGYPKDGSASATPYPQIAKGPNGSRTLTSFSLSAIAKKALEDAEGHYQANEYPEALAIYGE